MESGGDRQLRHDGEDVTSDVAFSVLSLDVPRDDNASGTVRRCGDARSRMRMTG